MALDQSIKNLARTLKHGTNEKLDQGLLFQGILLGTIKSISNQTVKLDNFKHPVEYKTVTFPYIVAGIKETEKIECKLNLKNGDRVIIAVINKVDFIILGVL